MKKDNFGKQKRLEKFKLGYPGQIKRDQLMEKIHVIRKRKAKSNNTIERQSRVLAKAGLLGP